MSSIVLLMPVKSIDPELAGISFPFILIDLQLARYGKM